MKNVKENLNEVMKLVKQSNIGKSEILKLESLLTLVVKNLEVTRILEKKNVHKITDFEW